MWTMRFNKRDREEVGDTPPRGSLSLSLSLTADDGRQHPRLALSQRNPTAEEGYPRRSLPDPVVGERRTLLPLEQVFHLERHEGRSRPRRRGRVVVVVVLDVHSPRRRRRGRDRRDDRPVERSRHPRDDEFGSIPRREKTPRPLPYPVGVLLLAAPRRRHRRRHRRRRIRSRRRRFDRCWFHFPAQRLLVRRRGGGRTRIRRHAHQPRHQGRASAACPDRRSYRFLEDEYAPNERGQHDRGRVETDGYGESRVAYAVHGRESPGDAEQAGEYAPVRQAGVRGGITVVGVGRKEGD